MLGRENVLEEGFELAYFIIGDHSAALKILERSLDKLQLLQKKEKRRAYWRRKHLKHWITKVSRTDMDTLQWLIYCDRLIMNSSRNSVERSLLRG